MALINKKLAKKITEPIYDDSPLLIDRYAHYLVPGKSYWLDKFTQKWRRKGMRYVLFKNMSFKKGLNVTVRKGIQDWAQNFSIGDYFEIRHPSEKNHDGPHYRMGIVESILECRLVNVPQYVLENEHDKECRTYNGLVNTLLTHYEDIGGDDIVTCIGFTVLEAK